MDDAFNFYTSDRAVKMFKRRIIRMRWEKRRKERKAKRDQINLQCNLFIKNN